jgi:hypothetical protein
MELDLQEAKEAAARLAKDESAKAHFDTLDEVLTKAGALPVKLFNTEASWLNPLLFLYKAHPDMFKTMVQWANDKRIQRGLTPLFGDRSQFDKTEYMREFMAQKRERERRVVAIENMTRSDRDKLRGRSRETYLSVLSRKWMDEKAALVEAEKLRTGKKGLDREVMTAITNAFWAEVDRKIDLQEEAALKKVRTSI